MPHLTLFVFLFGLMNVIPALLLAIGADDSDDFQRRVAGLPFGQLVRIRAMMLGGLALLVATPFLALCGGN